MCPKKQGTLYHSLLCKYLSIMFAGHKTILIDYKFLELEFFQLFCACATKLLHYGETFKKFIE